MAKWHLHPAWGSRRVDDWAPAVDVGRENPRWAQLADEEQSVREEAFFLQVLSAVAALYPNAIVEIEAPFGTDAHTFCEKLGAGVRKRGAVVVGEATQGFIEAVVTRQPIQMEWSCEGQIVLFMHGDWSGLTIEADSAPLPDG